MRKSFLVAAGFACSGLLGSAFALAAQQSGPDPKMNYFVTSKGLGKGGNLGGLEGADRHCQALATAAGFGNKTWRAYLSTQARPGKPAINARDRIGSGPWYNYKGVMIARDNAHLHGDTLEVARLGNNITKLTNLTEKGEVVPGLNDGLNPRSREYAYMLEQTVSNRHETLTGSQPDGRAYPPGKDYTCDNWTSEANGTSDNLRENRGANVQVGMSDRNGGGNGSWNSAHGTVGCSQQNLARTHGIGMYYCFASN